MFGSHVNDERSNKKCLRLGVEGYLLADVCL
jgi:hypothetical protein